MNNKWGDAEAKKSARAINASLSLENACLRAVPRYFQLDQDPTEILGEIFTALKRQYPEEYRIAFKTKATHLCKDCGQELNHNARRGYCSAHYQRHLKAGDFK